MHLKQYTDIEAFRSAVVEPLLENEVQNNLILSLITKNAYNTPQFAADWLLATVGGSGGDVALTAVYIKPFALLLYETGNKRRDDAVEILARELRRVNCMPSGVMAKSDLARRFSAAITGNASGGGAGAGRLHMVSSAMRLDKLEHYEKAPGFCRTLENRDTFFIPYWERAFSEDCRAHVFTIPEYTERLVSRLGKDTHYIWENGVPVSQAVHGRDTPNGAVINSVYTPPHYRGLGYATSVVAALSGALLDSGRSFCCLFADAENPVSCGIYRKLGFYDVCELEDIRFDI